jgi:hypothetical protein
MNVTQIIQQAIEAMEGFLAIVNDSRGVAGYHLNGDAAEWDEFDEVEAAEAAIAALKAHQSQPVDMVLYCPSCGKQHVDAPELHHVDEALERNGLPGAPDASWTNPPHRSHLCHSCGCIWRPADVPTNGVARIETTGKADTWFGGWSGRAVAAEASQPDTRLIDAVHIAMTAEAITSTRAEAPMRCAPCRSTGVFHCAHPDECGGPWTGNAEADRLIGRLLSSDPDFDDCTDAAELIRKLATQPTQAEAPRTPTLAECGETLGAPHPDWPAWCTTFRERLAYQHGVADARATQPTASKDEPSEADYAFDDLNLRLIEVTEERDHLRAALSQRPAQQAEVFPVILFQGHAIYAALSPQAKARTSAENVADVLDAAVAVLRQRRAAPSQRGGAA